MFFNALNHGVDKTFGTFFLLVLFQLNYEIVKLVTLRGIQVERQLLPYHNQ